MAGGRCPAILFQRWIGQARRTAILTAYGCRAQRWPYLKTWSRRALCLLARVAVRSAILMNRCERSARLLKLIPPRRMTFGGRTARPLPALALGGTRLTG